MGPVGGQRDNAGRGAGFSGDRPVGSPADHYARLPYPVEVVPTADGRLVARVRDLPGCTARAETPQELWEAVERAKREWIEDALRRGKPVPEPGGGKRSGGGEGRGGYSGRILVRVPKSLHAELIARAAQEGVSLNQFILATLARSLGTVRGEYMPPGADPPRPSRAKGIPGAPEERQRRGRGAPGPGQSPAAERD